MKSTEEILKEFDEKFDFLLSHHEIEATLGDTKNDIKSFITRTLEERDSALVEALDEELKLEYGNTLADGYKNGIKMAITLIQNK